MKRFVSMFLTVVVIAALLAVPAFADGLTIEVSTAEAAPGGAVTLEVSISGNPGIAAYSADLDFNEDYLELVSFSNGRTLRGLNFMSYVPTKRVVAFGAYNAAQNGTLFKAAFRVLEGAPAGFIPVSVVVSEMVSDTYVDYYPDVIAGGVTVTGGSGGGNAGQTPAGPAEEPQTDVVLETAPPADAGDGQPGSKPAGSQATAKPADSQATAKPAGSQTAAAATPDAAGQTPPQPTNAPGGIPAGTAPDGANAPDGAGDAAPAERPAQTGDTQAAPTAPAGDAAPAADPAGEAAPAADAADAPAAGGQPAADAGDKAPDGRPAAPAGEMTASENGGSGRLAIVVVAVVVVCGAAAAAVIMAKKKKQAGEAPDTDAEKGA